MEVFQRLFFTPQEYSKLVAPIALKTLSFLEQINWWTKCIIRLWGMMHLQGKHVIAQIESVWFKNKPRWTGCTPFSTSHLCHHIRISLPSCEIHAEVKPHQLCLICNNPFPQQQDWTAHPPAGMDDSPSSASLLISGVVFCFYKWLFSKIPFIFNICAPSPAGDWVPRRRRTKDE